MGKHGCYVDSYNTILDFKIIKPRSRLAQCFEVRFGYWVVRAKTISYMMTFERKIHVVENNNVMLYAVTSSNMTSLLLELTPSATWSASSPSITIGRRC